MVGQHVLVSLGIRQGVEETSRALKLGGDSQKQGVGKGQSGVEQETTWKIYQISDFPLDGPAE